MDSSGNIVAQQCNPSCLRHASDASKRHFRASAIYLPCTTVFHCNFQTWPIYINLGYHQRRTSLAENNKPRVTQQQNGVLNEKMSGYTNVYCIQNCVQWSDQTSAGPLWATSQLYPEKITLSLVSPSNPWCPINVGDKSVFKLVWCGGFF